MSVRLGNSARRTAIVPCFSPSSVLVATLSPSTRTIRLTGGAPRRLEMGPSLKCQPTGDGGYRRLVAPPHRRLVARPQ